MQNQGFDAWGIVWLIVVFGFLLILVVIRLVEWIKTPPSFKSQMSRIANRLTKECWYGDVSACVRIEDAWVEFIRPDGDVVARISVHELHGESIMMVSCDMSLAATTLFREVLSASRSGVHFRRISL